MITGDAEHGGARVDAQRRLLTTSARSRFRRGARNVDRETERSAELRTSRVNAPLEEKGMKLVEPSPTATFPIQLAGQLATFRPAAPNKRRPPTASPAEPGVRTLQLFLPVPRPIVTTSELNAPGRRPFRR